MAVNLHKSLPDAALHSPKGYAFASDGTKVTKDETGALNWQDDLSLPAALSFATATSAPPTEVTGDIYVLLGTPTGDWDGASANDWVRFDGSVWNAITPTEGSTCLNLTSGLLQIFDGSAWAAVGAGDGNFALNDLTLDASRTHDLDSNTLRFDMDTGTHANTYINMFHISGQPRLNIDKSGSSIVRLGSLPTSGNYDGIYAKRGYYFAGDSASNNGVLEETSSGTFLLRYVSGATTYLQLGSGVYNQNITGSLMIRTASGGTVAPSARLHVQGSGTTNATTSFLVENSAGTDVLKINDGQEIGFFNTTPVVQPSGTGETVGFTAGAGTGVNDDSTFTGNVGATAYRISDIVKALKNLGLIAQ